MSQNRPIQSAAAATFSPSSFLDASQPNLSRVFNYLTGGSAYFEADRVVAEKMLVEFPPLKKLVQLSKAFTVEAVQHLHVVEGFRQFLDLGSGIPSGDMVHQLVLDAMFVYSDINPVAVSYGRSLFSDHETIAYIRGNGREPEAIVRAPEVLKLIHMDKPVAIGLNGIQLFMPEADVRHMAQTFYEWAPAGSKLFLVFQTHGTMEEPENYYRFQDLCRQAQLPVELNTLADSVEMLDPWHPSLVEPITQFLGLPDDFITKEDGEGINMAFYAAFLLKQDQ